MKDRRKFLGDGLRWIGAAGLVGVGGLLVSRSNGDPETRWQIDPSKCIGCGRCATHCVLSKSAVICKHNFKMCGYCDPCTGYFDADPNDNNSGAENQLCPTAAIDRRFIEDPYYEYKIDEKLCIGCGKCVAGCNAFGNGSLYLQIDQSACENCNECAIAVVCPAQAIVRVAVESGSAKSLYISKIQEG